MDAGNSFLALIKNTRKRKWSKRTGGLGAGRPAGEEEQQQDEAAGSGFHVAALGSSLAYTPLQKSGLQVARPKAVAPHVPCDHLFVNYYRRKKKVNAVTEECTGV